ncbi:MAG: DNA-primase RepB domain-containing protein [Acetobacterales bacterium]
MKAETLEMADEKETAAAGDRGGRRVENAEESRSSPEIIPTERGAVHADAERFLRWLDPEAEAFTFQTFDEDRERKADALVKVLNGTLKQHEAELAQLSEKGAGIFITINRTDLRGRRAENIDAVRAVFVDLDGAPLEPVLACELPPHCVVESSPGRWHCYWRVAELPLGAFRDVQSGLAARFDGDHKVKDLPRVMRLPGFLHRKAEPFEVRIERLNELAAPEPAAAVRRLGATPVHDSPYEEGGRNNSLFVQLISLPEEYSEARLRAEAHRLNEEFDDGPLPSREVEGVVRSVLKRRAEPTVRSNEYGPLVKHLTEPISFVLHFRGDPVRLDAVEDLTSPTRLQNRIVEQTRHWPEPLTKKQLKQIMEPLLAEAEVEAMPEDATTSGIIWVQFLNFANANWQGRVLDEVLMGKSYKDYDKGLVFFRLQDFKKHLEQQRVRVKPSEVWNALKARGAQSQVQVHLKGANTKLWTVPLDKVEAAAQKEEFDPPRFGERADF